MSVSLSMQLQYSYSNIQTEKILGQRTIVIEWKICINPKRPKRGHKNCIDMLQEGTTKQTNKRRKKKHLQTLRKEIQENLKTTTKPQATNKSENKRRITDMIHD